MPVLGRAIVGFVDELGDLDELLDELGEPERALGVPGLLCGMPADGLEDGGGVGVARTTGGGDATRGAGDGEMLPPAANAGPGQTTSAAAITPSNALSFRVNATLPGSCNAGTGPRCSRTSGTPGSAAESA